MKPSKRNTTKPADRSGVIPAAQHRNSAGRMRHANDRRRNERERAARNGQDGW